MASLRKIWSKLTSDRSLGGRILLILTVIAILILAIILSGPKPETIPLPTSATLNPAINQLTPSLQPIPSSEYVQTTGVIVAVVTIVVIVLAGTLVELNLKYNRNDKKG